MHRSFSLLNADKAGMVVDLVDPDLLWFCAAEGCSDLGKEGTAHSPLCECEYI
jgi:hypothetical protein